VLGNIYKEATTRAKMLEVVRSLSDVEFELLSAIDKMQVLHAGNHVLCRSHGTPRLENLLERLEEPGWPSEDELIKNFYSALIAFQEFLKGQRSYFPLEIEEVLKKEETITHFANLPKGTLKDMLEGCFQDKRIIIASDWCNWAIEHRQEPVRAIRTALKKRCQPRYYGLSKLLSFDEGKIENIARGLRGIISLEMGDQYFIDELFIPSTVYAKYVLPALKNNPKRITFKVKDETLIRVLEFIYDKTKELRVEYGNRFRPEFKRPQLIRELNLPQQSVAEFKRTMAPLEGILGRIKRDHSFVLKDKKRKVYCERPSWFLPVKHQEILQRQIYKE